MEDQQNNNPIESSIPEPEELVIQAVSPMEKNQAVVSKKKSIGWIIFILIFSIILIISIYLIIGTVNNPDTDPGFIDPTTTPVSPTPSLEGPVISYDDYLVICSPKECNIKTPDGGLIATDVDHTYSFDGHIAYKYDPDTSTLLVYKFNGSNYDKKQEYDITQESISNLFVTKDYIYTYVSSLAELDDIPFPAVDMEGFEPEYENDIEGSFIRYGIEDTSMEDLKTVTYLNALSMADTIGQALDIVDVDESDSVIYYYDQAGGGFFGSLYILDWESDEESNLDLSNSGVFLSMSSDHSSFYFYDYQHLIKHDFFDETIIQDVGNDHVEILSFKDIDTPLYSLLKEDDNILKIFESRDDIPVELCSFNLPLVRNLRGIVGTEGIYFRSLENNNEYLIDLDDCSYSGLDFEDLRLVHVLLVPEN